MKRFAYNKMLEWKQRKVRKPLIVRGARQVGKTWLMHEFGKCEYEQVLYINFEDKKQLKQLFDVDFNIERILLALQVETGIKPEPNRCLIILDELQEAKRGITSLKYFYEQAPEYHVMAAGSYLGIAMHNNDSFPVGKVEFLDIAPLSFREFLEAKAETGLVSLLQNRNWELISAFKEKLIGLLRLYYFIGGMPEVVASFISDENFENVRKLQKDILSAYVGDFSKHAPTLAVPRINMVWDSLPSQLAKENRKFMFGILKKGARAKDFELALEWLIGSGLLHKVNRVSKPGLPLKAYADSSAFKVFAVDVGLLGAMSDLHPSSIIYGSKIFEEFKGALTEQFVFQQLKGQPLYYWSSERSSGEIDFIVQTSSGVLPIEVKAEENLHAKSLKFFHQKYKLPISMRISMSDFRKQDWMINVPLYAVDHEMLEQLSEE